MVGNTSKTKEYRRNFYTVTKSVSINGLDKTPNINADYLDRLVTGIVANYLMQYIKKYGIDSNKKEELIKMRRSQMISLNNTNKSNHLNLDKAIK